MLSRIRYEAAIRLLEAFAAVDNKLAMREEMNP